MQEPLPLTDNKFISLTVRNGISLHVPSCLIAIGGNTSCVLHHASKFSIGIDKVHLSICHTSKPYILTNAREHQTELSNVLSAVYFFIFIKNLYEKDKYEIT